MSLPFPSPRAGPSRFPGSLTVSDTTINIGQDTLFKEFKQALKEEMNNMDDTFARMRALCSAYEGHRENYILQLQRELATKDAEIARLQELLRSRENARQGNDVNQEIHDEQGERHLAASIRAIDAARASRSNEAHHDDSSNRKGKARAQNPPTPNNEEELLAELSQDLELDLPIFLQHRSQLPSETGDVGERSVGRDDEDQDVFFDSTDALGDGPVADHDERGQRDGHPDEGGEFEFVGTEQPPRTSPCDVGPFKLRTIIERLRLPRQVETKIKKLLLTSQEPTLRVWMHQDLVFVCDPLVLETLSESYVVAWGRPAELRRLLGSIRRHIRRQGAAHHTFVLDTQRKAWWYLGLLEWNRKQIENVWDLYTRYDDVEGKKILAEQIAHSLQRISDRNSRGAEAQEERDKYNDSDIAEMLDTGELAQASFTLVRPGDAKERSYGFARERLECLVADCPDRCL
ncbi:hypothetical protein K474DRAFT_512631 [Panus rudis PR-1116 ss-1]|nr:hypothetical protein K474DRAFT_512631 [Panus rudis PR-1116 ss-1]